MNLCFLIVDDEQAVVNVLTNYISKTPYMELAGAYFDPIATLEVDVVDYFLSLYRLTGFACYSEGEGHDVAIQELLPFASNCLQSLQHRQSTIMKKREDVGIFGRQLIRLLNL